MLGQCVFNFVTVFCSLYVYAKLLKLKKSLITIAADIAFSLILSVITYYVWLYVHPLVIPVLFVSIYIYSTLTTKTEPGLSITTTAIGFGISFALYLISSILLAASSYFISAGYSSINENLGTICLALTQLLLCWIPWRFRRLKSGMPFLRKKGGGNFGVIISMVLLCCVIVFSNSKDPRSIFFIGPVIFVFLCGIGILFWWRNRLQKAYIEKLRTNELQNLRDTIQEKEKQLQQLKESNDALAKIIHKDNKLIPSMELAVTEYLQLIEKADSTDIQIKGQMLLEQLKEIACDRSGIIVDYQSQNKKIPSTNVFPIDTLMSYMLNKAKENGIKFDVAVSGSVRYLVENIISVSDLRTLLADLIENAIIATKDCFKREILVSLGVCEGYYLAEVFDSGRLFEKEPLINFGLKKTTTHVDTGGSGIGLMTVSEILSNYRASFVIEEYPDQYNILTKKVSVRFDNLSQYVVNAGSVQITRTISAREAAAIQI